MKYGKFKISHNRIKNDHDYVRSIMGECVIVSAEYSPITDYMEYDAICRNFRDLEEYEDIPEYHWVQEDNNTLLPYEIE